jgi:hypothetical protein
MIALSRADVRRFRLVARRCVPNGRPRGPAPPVRIAAAGDTVTLAAHYGEVVVALTVPAAGPGRGKVCVPLTALEQFEAAGPGVATLEPSGPAHAAVKWDGPDGGTARVDQVAWDVGWPDEPGSLAPVPPEFLTALHEAGRTAARDPGRYAVTRVLLKGSAGEVVGTDGKQALAWGGFALPFDTDLLVPAVPVFGAKELLVHQADATIDPAGDWVCVAAGPWRVWLLVDREGRFPDVHGAVPKAPGTRVHLADADADRLLAALPGLPAPAGPASPVTLDLGERVVARASAGPDGPTAEVVLPESTATGPPVRFVMPRDHLGRALALGFRELRVSNPERPLVARDRHRLYLAATLDPSCAVGPPDSPAISSSPHRRTTMPRDSAPPDRNGHPEPPSGDALDPLVEGEGLRASLADAAARAHRLVAALKQFRKERRALSAAFTSLKQLNLGP